MIPSTCFSSSAAVRLLYAAVLLIILALATGWAVALP